MIFRLASDLHTEFFEVSEMARLAREALPPLDDDKKTTLLLAGDIGSAERLENIVELITYLSPRFKEILYIPGNHEYYHGDFSIALQNLREPLYRFDNVMVTAAGSKSADTCRIHMHTLWTDFDKENPMSMLEAQSRMNDYRMITNGNSMLKPADTLQRHKQHIHMLRVLSPFYQGDLVMTHHSPSLRSIPAEYLHDRVNGAYHSDLEWLIEEKKPAVWVHGHTHTACDYMLGSTRIICNPPWVRKPVPQEWL